MFWYLNMLDELLTKEHTKKKIINKNSSIKILLKVIKNCFS